MGNMRQGTRCVPWIVHPAVHHLYSLTPGSPRPKTPVLVAEGGHLHPEHSLGTALFPLLHPGLQGWGALRDSGGSVPAVSHSGEQLCVGVCQGPAVKAQKAAALPPTSLLRQYLQPISLVWVFSGCIWDVAESWSIRKGHWGGGPDSLCVTLADFFLTVMTDELLI